MYATNVVNLISAGAINQTGGSLVAGTLTGSAATSTSLTQPANQLDTLGAFSTTAGFALVNNKSLLYSQPGTGCRRRKHARADYQDRRHHAGRQCECHERRGPKLGRRDKPDRQVIGRRHADGSAATSASLTQPANQIDTLGAFSTKAGFGLVNNKSLLVAGPVTDTGGASTPAR